MSVDCVLLEFIKGRGGGGRRKKNGEKFIVIFMFLPHQKKNF